FFRNSAEENVAVTDVTALRGDVAAGKGVFESKCATCHKVKKAGNGVGPDLTLIKTKFDRAALLDAIINPDAGIVFGYEAWTITLSDGQSHFGFLLADGAQTVTLRDLTGRNHVID